LIFIIVLLNLLSVFFIIPSNTAFEKPLAARVLPPGQQHLLFRPLKYLVIPNIPNQQPLGSVAAYAASRAGYETLAANHLKLVPESADL
jgi:hypothetical protein